MRGYRAAERRWSANHIGGLLRTTIDAAGVACDEVALGVVGRDRQIGRARRAVAHPRQHATRPAWPRPSLARSMPAASSWWSKTVDQPRTAREPQQREEEVRRIVHVQRSAARARQPRQHRRRDHATGGEILDAPCPQAAPLPSGSGKRVTRTPRITSRAGRPGSRGASTSTERPTRDEALRLHANADIKRVGLFSSTITIPGGSRRWRALAYGR